MKVFIYCLLAVLLVQFVRANDCDEKTLRIASYNTGLVPGDNGHLSKLLEVIPRSLDVLALEEVWLQSDATIIKNSLKQYYPYSYYAPYDQGSKVGCKEVSQNLTQAFFSCIISNKIATIGWETITPCFPELRAWMAQDYNCAVCYISSISSGLNVTETGQKCFSGNGYMYAYGGSTGLMVLSRKPIQNATYTSLSSFLLRRGLLEMCIDGLYIVSSHYPFEYPLPLVQDLQSDFSTQVIKKRPNILLGDLNSGINYQPKGYKLLVDYGYKSVNPNLPTYCISNSSIAGSCDIDTDRATKIDHILYDNEVSDKSLNWVRKTRFSITTFGSRIPTVSDHIGIYSELVYNLKRRHIYCK